MSGRFHVLIVEDEPLIVEVLHGILESKYRVSSAYTIREALAFLRTSHVDVVLLDSILPDGRGIEVSSVAEANGAVVIEMSGYPQEMYDLQRSNRIFLCKPFGPEVVLSTIENAIHGKSNDAAPPAATRLGETPYRTV